MSPYVLPSHQAELNLLYQPWIVIKIKVVRLLGGMDLHVYLFHSRCVSYGLITDYIQSTAFSRFLLRDSTPGRLAEGFI